MGFWKNVSPKRAARDFAGEWQKPSPYRWRVLAVSVALTAGIMIMAIPKSERIEPRRPNIFYITTFEDGRTDEEIMASNILNQERQDRLNQMEEERAERRKALYRALGRATGLDVDEMERKIAEEEAQQALAAPEATAEQDAAPADGE